MRYRAIAYLPNEPTPRQAFSSQRKQMSDWACLILAGAPVGTRVEIWEVKEVMVAQFSKKPPVIPEAISDKEVRTT